MCVLLIKNENANIETRLNLIIQIKTKQNKTKKNIYKELYILVHMVSYVMSLLTVLCLLYIYIYVFLKIKIKRTTIGWFTWLHYIFFKSLIIQTDLFD